MATFNTNVFRALLIYFDQSDFIKEPNYLLSVADFRGNNPPTLYKVFNKF